MQSTITMALEACREMVGEYYEECAELSGMYEGADSPGLEMARMALIAAQVNGDAFYCPRCGLHLRDQATEQLPYEGYTVCAVHVEYPIQWEWWGAAKFKFVSCEEGR